MPQTVGQANVKAAARAKLMIFAEEAASRWRERADTAEGHLKRIIETINLLPSVTGLSPISRPEDAWMAIRELQEAYGDAARARNGEAGPLLRRQAEQHKKEIAAWRERAERAEAELAKVTAELEVCSLAREVHVKRGVELEAEVERLRKELADYKRTIAYIEPRIDKMLAVLKGGGQQEGS